jgi:integrase
MSEEMKQLKPGRVNGKNSAYRSGEHHIPKRCNNQIVMVLKANRDKAAHKEKTVGASTQDKRETVIFGFFGLLFYLKFKIESIYHLKQKHLIAVFNFLEEQGQSPSTIQNKISIMRVFCEWIGKNGMVLDSRKYVKDKSSVRRSLVAREDKSWEGQGIEFLSKLSEVAQMDATVAINLELSLAFGLRVKESIMLRPGAEQSDDFLWVREGTKGGRPRVIRIENDIQRDVLKRASSIADKKSGFLGNRYKTYEQKRRRFYYVLEVCGITLREEQITAHGLRHQYMQKRFKDLLGIDAPVKGGNLGLVDKDELHVTSQKIMEEAGHTRVDIGSAYYGSRRHPGKAQSPKGEDA